MIKWYYLLWSDAINFTRNNVKFMGIWKLLTFVLFACQEANTTTQATPKKTNEHHVQKGADTKKIEIDSVSYARMDDKINLDYDDTTNQRAIFNSQLLTDFEVFLTGEVNDYSKYKLFYNEMRSARDTVFILNKGQNFYRYIKKDPKTKLVFDAYMENIQSLPKKLKYNIRLLDISSKLKKLFCFHSIFWYICFFF